MPLFSACCNREGKIIWGVSANRDSGRRNDVPSLPVPLSPGRRLTPAASCLLQKPTNRAFVRTPGSYPIYFFDERSALSLANCSPLD